MPIIKKGEQTMEKIASMAEAHLGNVQKALNDLRTQKQNIENEITKLEEYLQDGIKELEAFRQSDAKEVVVDGNK